MSTVEQSPLVEGDAIKVLKPVYPQPALAERGAISK